jgi:hypothetical protein
MSETSTSSTSTEPPIPIHNGRHRSALSDQIIPRSGAPIEAPQPAQKIMSDQSQSVLSDAPSEAVSPWQLKANARAANDDALVAAEGNPAFDRATAHRTRTERLEPERFAHEGLCSQRTSLRSVGTGRAKVLGPRSLQ